MGRVLTGCNIGKDGTFGRQNHITPKESPEQGSERPFIDPVSKRMEYKLTATICVPDHSSLAKDWSDEVSDILLPSV